MAASESRLAADMLSDRVDTAACGDLLATHPKTRRSPTLSAAEFRGTNANLRRTIANGTLYGALLPDQDWHLSLSGISAKTESAYSREIALLHMIITYAVTATNLSLAIQNIFTAQKPYALISLGIMVHALFWQCFVIKFMVSL